MNKSAKIYFLTLLVLMLGGILYSARTYIGFGIIYAYQYGQYLRITVFPPVLDPDDPKFNIQNFRLENYSDNSDALAKALIKLFPPGTSKAQVENVLSEIAGTIITQSPGYNNFSYMRFSWGGISGWDVRVVYDENLRTKQLYIGTRNLYQGGKNGNK